MRVLLLACIAPFVVGSPVDGPNASNALAPRDRAVCKIPEVKQFAKKVKKIAGPVISPFCSSYLSYGKTKTITSTYTALYFTDKVITSGTLTLADFSTVYTATTTYSVTELYVTYTGAAIPKAKRAPPPAPAAQVTAGLKLLRPNKNDGVLGIKASVVSQACSCLVTGKPAATTTKVKEITKTTTETIAIPTRTVTQTDTVTVSYAEFEYYSTTSTATVPATCADAKPTFFAQLQEVDLAKGDQFGGQYISGVTRLKPEEDTVSYLRTTPEISSAILFTLDSDSRLTAWPVATVPFFVNVDQYFSFSLLGLNTADYMSLRNSYFVKCALTTTSGTSFIDCSAPDSYYQQSILQTCPLYQEYYDTPLVLGAEYSETSPDCFRKRLKVVPACKPKT